MASPNRPKVGPADPETRRRKLAEVLGTPSKATGVAKKPTMLDAVSKGVDEASDTLPNGQKRRVGKKTAKKPIVKRFGEKGQTEEELGL